MINDGDNSRQFNYTSDKTDLRGFIQESWQRCSKLDRDSFPHQTFPGLRELIHLLEDSRLLIKSSLDVIDNLAAQCRNHASVACIFNQRGTLLYFRASEAFDEQASDMNIFVGASWSEESMGTNSAAAALKCGQPVVIFKEEHYYKKMCKYKWIGAPVKDRDNSIIGAVCIGFEDAGLSSLMYDEVIHGVKVIEGKFYSESGDIVENRQNFFSEIVHESRNALTACEGFIQFMLIKKMFNSEYLDIVLSELRRVTDILNSYSFISSTHRDIKYCNINNCIREINTLLFSKLSLRSIDLNLSLSEIPEILIDPSRLKQILLNMIENAIDAIGKEGSIKITTCCRDDYITIKIKDTGCGIDPSIKDKIFTPFFTTKSKGTGLGLHVCRTIIESYRGNIELESTPGMGTAFIITFPVDKKAADYL